MTLRDIVDHHDARCPWCYERRQGATWRATHHAWEVPPCRFWDAMHVLAHLLVIRGPEGGLFRDFHVHWRVWQPLELGVAGRLTWRDGVRYLWRRAER